MQDLPEELLEGLALAAGQVISDMEETPAIADVPLLCGVALVRDDVLRRLEDLRAGAADSARTGRRAVPEHIAATIKELVLVGDTVARRSQLCGCAPPCALRAVACVSAARALGLRRSRGKGWRVARFAQCGSGHLCLPQCGAVARIRMSVHPRGRSASRAGVERSLSHLCRWMGSLCPILLRYEMPRPL